MMNRVSLVFLMVVGCCASAAVSSSQDAENVAIDIDESKIEPSNQLEYGCDNYIEKKQDESAPASPNEDSDSSEGEKNQEVAHENTTDIAAILKEKEKAFEIIKIILEETDGWYQRLENAQAFVATFNKLEKWYNNSATTKEERNAILYFVRHIASKVYGEVWYDSRDYDEEHQVIDTAIDLYSKMIDEK